MKKTLINISNHPSSKWSEKQLAACDGYEIVDLPFPNVDPEADEVAINDLVDEYISKCRQISKENGAYTRVHVMGEMTFVHRFVRSCIFPCVASTTKRLSVENPDGTKTVAFEFCRFRKYE